MAEQTVNFALAQSERLAQSPRLASNRHPSCVTEHIPIFGALNWTPRMQSTVGQT